MSRTAEFPDWVLAVGEEGSDPLVLHGGRTVRVDEYAMSGHLDRVDEDLAAVAALGVAVWRYGMPWRLVEPEPGTYDWGLWDRALAACDRHGLIPVVDLCHFGLPDHLGGFCDPAWVDAFARYVEAFLARYRDPMWFTPVNEPFITAVNSALFARWNDRRASLEDLGVALTHVSVANTEAIAAVRADRDGWWVGAEGFAVPLGPPEAQAEVDQVRAVSQLVWDLHLGVDPRPEAEAALVAVPDAMRDRLVPLVDPHHVVAGHDVYPVSVMVLGEQRDLTIDERLDAYDAEARTWHDRYDVPFWVAETSNLGLPVADQVPWLDGLVARLAALRADGLPVHGLCWYSRGDQYDWQTDLTEPVGAVTEVGLFDAERRPRPVASHITRYLTAP